jgi:long-chain fatty acid transport protein
MVTTTRRVGLTLRAAALVSGALLANGEARGAGFSLQENDAKSLGMSNAFTATADNPSAVYYNPAGMAQLDGLQGELTLVLIDINGDYDPDPGEGADADLDILAPVPSVFGTLELTENLYLGIGTFAPFGLSVDWGNRYGGRYIVDEASIEVIETNGVFAMKIPFGENMLALSAGASVIQAKARLKRNIDQRAVGAPDAYAEVHLGTESNYIDWRWNAAFLLTLLDGSLRIGASYRHSVDDLTVEGRAEFINTAPAIRAVLPRASAARADTALPNEVRAGIAFNPLEELTVEVDYKWTNWSMTGDMPIRFRRADGTRDESVLRFDFDDTSFVAIGAEYRLIKDFLALRAGVYWDESPQRPRTVSPALPDNDRVGFSLGIGLTPTKNTFVDFGYLYVDAKTTRKRNQIGAEPPNLGTPRGQGTYEMFANLFGFTVGLRF